MVNFYDNSPEIFRIIYHYNLFPQYKIQPAESWPDADLVKQCLKKLSVDHFVVRPFTFWFLYPSFKKYGSVT
jgi:hypothetical protein